MSVIVRISFYCWWWIFIKICKKHMKRCKLWHFWVFTHKLGANMQKECINRKYPLFARFDEKSFSCRQTAPYHAPQLQVDRSTIGTVCSMEQQRKTFTIHHLSPASSSSSRQQIPCCKTTKHSQPATAQAKRLKATIKKHLTVLK